MPEYHPNQSREEPKNQNTLNNKKKTATNLLIGAFVFAAVQAFGILTAARIKELFSPLKEEIPVLTVADFIAVFVITTIFLLFVLYALKFRKIKKTFLKVLFSFVTFTGAAVFFGVWFLGALPIWAAFFLALLWWFYPTVFTQNVCVFFAILGAGLSLGLIFPPEAIIILLILFSVYDFVSVYFTKHMVRLAKEMLTSQAIAAFFIPSDFSGFGENIKTAAAGGGRFMILGGGDVVFPLMLTVSAVDQFGILAAVVIGLFALAGFVLSFYIFISQKTKKPIPALPAIALFSIIGYFVSLVI